MKFKIESEFCESVMPIIFSFWGKDVKYLQAIPEAPKNYYSNDHIDMIVLNRKKMELFGIEFKLNDLKGLKRQVHMTLYTLNTIGIINRKQKDKDPRIFSIYDSKEDDIEINRLRKHLLKPKSYKSIFTTRFGMVYWWGYLNVESSFAGGLAKAKRPTFHHLYITAIMNLQKYYKNKLDQREVFAILGCYSPVSFNKYYEMAMIKIEEEK